MGLDLFAVCWWTRFTTTKVPSWSVLLFHSHGGLFPVPTSSTRCILHVNLVLLLWNSCLMPASHAALTYAQDSSLAVAVGFGWVNVSAPLCMPPRRPRRQFFLPPASSHFCLGGRADIADSVAQGTWVALSARANSPWQGNLSALFIYLVFTAPFSSSSWVPIVTLQSVFSYLLRRRKYRDLLVMPQEET